MSTTLNMNAPVTRATQAASKPAAALPLHERIMNALVRMGERSMLRSMMERGIYYI